MDKKRVVDREGKIEFVDEFNPAVDSGDYCLLPNPIAPEDVTFNPCGMVSFDGGGDAIVMSPLVPHRWSPAFPIKAEGCSVWYCDRCGGVEITEGTTVPLAESGCIQFLIPDPMNPPGRDDVTLGGGVLRDPERTAENFRYNARVIGGMTGEDQYDPFPADIVFIVGSGPSVEEYDFRSMVEEFRAKGKSIHIIACNGGIEHCHPDTFCVIDDRFRLDDEKFYNCDLVASPFVDRSIVEDHGWNQLDWIIPDTHDPVCESELWDAAVAKCTPVRQGLNVTHTAILWAVKRLKPRAIVTFGFDFACSYGEFYKGQLVTRESVGKNPMIVEGCSGELVITNRAMKNQAEVHRAVAYFLDRAGIKVLNASGLGIFHKKIQIGDGEQFGVEQVGEDYREALQELFDG